MIQLVMASTLFSAMTAAAAIDEGLLGPRDTTRILVVSNNAAVPEVVQPLHRIPGSDTVLERFDRVVDLNEALVQAHPSSWRPRHDDLAMHQQHFRSLWGLGTETVQLVTESLHVPPASSLARIFGDSELVVLSEGLMSFGPTRFTQPPQVAQRIASLVYLELVAGLRPLLFEELDIPHRPVSMDAFRVVVNEMAEVCAPAIDAAVPPSDVPTAIVFGQYLSALGLWTPEEEEAAHIGMMRTAYDKGARRIVFKPHPAASPALLNTYRDAAESWGAQFVTWEDGTPAEVLLARVPCVVIVAGFSTVLVTARALFGTPIESYATEELLGSLTPFQNSNRVPVTIVDALTRHAEDYGAVESLQSLVVAVSYAMQARHLDHRREEAVATLAQMPSADRHRYFYRKRLTALDLPGGAASGRFTRTLRRWGRRLPASWRRRLAW
ncbi:polysialyltransferase family glycosyltransferase [Demequina sp. NBRC 110051]|uniref:polysialyltransferase family glycosyltransferase n=1 Tax=Demequina sp. NBRC 110051 TaxID=1570340 RepID=UPI000A05909E|nr:polysialyltransferase family glycosyltransferase [Demequina sp. NBRC 110051]